MEWKQGDVFRVKEPHASLQVDGRTAVVLDVEYDYVRFLYLRPGNDLESFKGAYVGGKQGYLLAKKDKIEKL